MKNTAPDRVPNCEKFAMNFIILEYEYNKIWLFFLQYSNNGNG